jgi:hypothetical protein
MNRILLGDWTGQFIKLGLSRSNWMGKVLGIPYPDPASRERGLCGHVPYPDPASRERGLYGKRRKPNEPHIYGTLSQVQPGWTCRLPDNHTNLRYIPAWR